MEKCRYNGGTYIQASFKSHLTSGVYMDPNCQFEATSSPCWGLYEAKCLGVSPGCPGGEKYKFKGFAFFSYVSRAELTALILPPWVFAFRYFHNLLLPLSKSGRCLSHSKGFDCLLGPPLHTNRVCLAHPGKSDKPVGKYDQMRNIHRQFWTIYGSIAFSSHILRAALYNYQCIAMAKIRYTKDERVDTRNEILGDCKKASDCYLSSVALNPLEAWFEKIPILTKFTSNSFNICLARLLSVCFRI